MSRSRADVVNKLCDTAPVSTREPIEIAIAQGMPIRDIMKNFGVTKRQIYKWMEDHA